MGGFPVLSFMTFLPAAGALVILIVRSATAKRAGEEGSATLMPAAFLVTLVTFILSLFLLAGFDPSASGYQFVEDVAWFGGVERAVPGLEGGAPTTEVLGGIRYKLGIDGMALVLILLTTFLTPLCILASWHSIKHRVAEYVVAFLLLETLMLGVFCAQDLFLFYVFFEAGLIPMFLIIGVWGGKDRLYASFKFFLYTLAGSLFMLAAIAFMFLVSDTLPLNAAVLNDMIAGTLFDTGRELVPGVLSESQRMLVVEALDNRVLSGAINLQDIRPEWRELVISAAPDRAPTSDIAALEMLDWSALWGSENSVWARPQTWLFLAFLASFAVKLPMWPVHTWLPDAHVQAPTAGSVILAGVLLKMGGYGFLRFSIPMFSEASQFFQPMMFALSVIAIVYASLVAFRQTDMKKLIAYSSVAHMGFVTIGIFSFTEIGVQGAIFQMISHGVISAALFLIVGVIYDRMHTREIAAFGGVVHVMPIYAAIFMLFTMGNVGLPGTSGFVGEMLTMTGGFVASTWVAFGAAFGVILSAVYMLSLYRRTMFGPVGNDEVAALKDIGGFEWATLVPLSLATVILGVSPGLVFDMTEAASANILTLFQLGLGS